jgi:hypothetical protein
MTIVFNELQMNGMALIGSLPKRCLTGKIASVLIALPLYIYRFRMLIRMERIIVIDVLLII